MKRSSNVRAILVVFGVLMVGRAASAQGQPPPPPSGDDPGGLAPPDPQAPEDSAPASPTGDVPVRVESHDAPSAPPPPAWYESPAPAPSAPSPHASGSYGAQIVLTDLGAVLLGALLTDQSNSAIPILVSWSFASPLVHVVHGHPGRGVLSLLLHVGAPIVGAYVGVQVEHCGTSSSDDDFCGLAGLLLGGLVGMVTATTIDAAVLAQLADAPPPPPAYRRGIASAPAMSVTHRGDLTFGWRGTF